MNRCCRPIDSTNIPALSRRYQSDPDRLRALPQTLRQNLFGGDGWDSKCVVTSTGGEYARGCSTLVAMEGAGPAGHRKPESRTTWQRRGRSRSRLGRTPIAEAWTIRPRRITGPLLGDEGLECQAPGEGRQRVEWGAGAQKTVTGSGLAGGLVPKTKVRRLAG